MNKTYVVLSQLDDGQEHHKSLEIGQINNYSDSSDAINNHNRDIQIYYRILSSLGYQNRGLFIFLFTFLQFGYNIYLDIKGDLQSCSSLTFSLPIDIICLLSSLTFLGMLISSYKHYFTVEDVHSWTIVYLLTIIQLRSIITMFFISYTCNINIFDVATFKLIDIAIYTLLYGVYLFTIYNSTNRNLIDDNATICYSIALVILSMYTITSYLESISI
jgi:hypothetical protein